MLILGDISGIQDFLFDVRERGGKQAAMLRFRSLRLQLIIEAIARRVLWELKLPESHLLYCAAGKFQIDANGISGIDEKLNPIRADIETWLIEHTHGRLRCTIVADESPGTAVQRNDAANANLQRGKLRAWAGASWADRLIVSSKFDLDVENECDAKLGRKLLEQQFNTIVFSAQSETPDDDLVGVQISFENQPPTSPAEGQSSKSFDAFARHTPRRPGDSTKLVEFVDLAKQSRGVPTLGVLKADADNLGAAIRKRLGISPSFQPLVDFSGKLETFFGQTLQREMANAQSRWQYIYTVFAGGDDLLLVGPWNVIIDFAAHVREKFASEFKADGLTISAGCAIVKRKFPVHLAAQQAEELLKIAKTGLKNQFAVLGDVLKWDDHPTIINAGKQLADWVDTDDIKRGWLHTLLELALLRREETPPRDAKIIPAMAASRLSYHVARNWPKLNAEGEKGNARQWIDNVIRHFDNFDKTTDPITIHLPAIIRYAMLATRGKGDEA